MVGGEAPETVLAPDEIWSSFIPVYDLQLNKWRSYFFLIGKKLYNKLKWTKSNSVDHLFQYCIILVHPRPFGITLTYMYRMILMFETLRL